MKIQKPFLFVLGLAGVFFLAMLLGQLALAQEPGPGEGQEPQPQAPQIQFPIPELGNCTDRAACKAYCDDLSHRQACIEFARSHGLIKADEATKVEKLPQAGPGGCRGVEACRTFCEAPENHDQCLKFARQHGMISTEEAERAQKFMQAMQAGGPGGCRTERECRTYCDNPDHLDECLAFGKKLGAISPEQEARIKSQGLGKGPGGCMGKEACRAYCNEEAHREECLAFAQEHGLMSRKEAERARVMAGKIGPGGCQGEACHEYCEDPAHEEECVAFAKQHGLLDKEDEEQIEAGRKARQKIMQAGGPGGCRTERECRTYCSDEAHMQECLEFAAKMGLKPLPHLQEMRQKMESRGMGPNIEFEQGDSPKMFPGPGGCTSAAACKEYCLAHPDECRDFQAPFMRSRPFQEGKDFPPRDPAGGTFQPRSMIGPGGCSSPAECMKYCAEHREECAAFKPAVRPGLEDGTQPFEMNRPENLEPFAPFRQPFNAPAMPGGFFTPPQPPATSPSGFLGVKALVANLAALLGL